MARHELGEGVDHRDNGLGEILILHTGGAPQGAGAGHVASMGGGTGTVFRHGISPELCVDENGALSDILWGEHIHLATIRCNW